MRRESRLLKEKAIASFRRATAAFNGLENDGRATSVLLHFQHAFEMLMKAALRQQSVSIFNRSTGRSVGFEKCVNLAQEHLGLSDEQRGLLRAIDALRDDEQHYIAELSEGLLYLHCRAAVTLFDEMLKQSFDENLADHLPERVLPLSTTPPENVEVLINAQFDQIERLLRPGQRRQAEARALVRGLLAMEGHVAQTVSVSERDVNRVARAIRGGKALGQVFPRLRSVGTDIAVDGSTLVVHFTKRQGAPVHYIPADDPREAAAVRQVDLQLKYHLSRRDLANGLGLTQPRATALRRHLQIDNDENCAHVFTFDSQTHHRYSDNALRRMEHALAQLDIDQIWQTSGAWRGHPGA